LRERDGGQCSAATADVFSDTRILVATAAAPLSNFFASFMAVAFLTFFFSSPQYWAY
jgi:hypothetical protein